MKKRSKEEIEELIGLYDRLWEEGYRREVILSKVGMSRQRYNKIIRDYKEEVQGK